MLHENTQISCPNPHSAKSATHNANVTPCTQKNKISQPPDFSTEAKIEFGTAPEGRNREDYPLVLISGDDYDAHSIMHYTSDAHAGKKYDQLALEKASLTM